MAKKDMLLAIGIGKPKEREYPEFDIPEGMDVTDLEEGDEKEIVAKVKLKDGRLCLVSVDGIALSEMDDDDPEDMVDEMDEEEATENEETDASQSAFTSGDSYSGGLGQARAAGLM